MPEKPRNMHRRLRLLAILLVGSAFLVLGQATVAAGPFGTTTGDRMLLRPPQEPGPADAACVTCHEQHSARADCTTCHTNTHPATTTD